MHSPTAQLATYRRIGSRDIDENEPNVHPTTWATALHVSQLVPGAVARKMHRKVWRQKDVVRLVFNSLLKKQKLDT